MTLEPRINLINEYLEREMQQLETYAKGLERNLIDPTEQLDQLFRYTLKEVWND